MKIIDSKDWRVAKSPHYNYVFNKKDGFFARWGKNKDDDPDFSPYGPELLDVEISTICHKACSHCYKSNTDVGENMSLETFSNILSKMPKTLTQAAFGIGSIDGNPDLWKIMEHCREKSVVPNITINGYRMKIDDYWKLASLCGAVAVSNYNKDTCYNAVYLLNRAVLKLAEPTLKQVNIHQLLAEETIDQCIDLLKDVQKDWRLKNLNAVVFLLLKPKGERNTLHSLKDSKKYKHLIDYALNNKLRIGFDSCSFPRFIRAIENHKSYESMKQCAEPCESFGLFSSYINVKGEYFPCSFAEGMEEWKEGIDVLNCKDFLEDVWYSPKLRKWRNISMQMTTGCNCKSKDSCRTCPIFDIAPCYSLSGEKNFGEKVLSMWGKEGRKGI